ncbi:MAG: MBL fold metallo-hydrolase [Azoarcus sp.]|nr:MBL fold metallo-hydrolase [Azoarcus sp.]
MTTNEIEYPFPDLPAAGIANPIAPGINWVRMPLPFALDHINLWLLDDGNGMTVVDTGFGLDPIKARWTEILEADPRPLSRIIVTHCHPDHLGLATWLATRNGAPIHMTQGEYLGGHALWHQLPGYSVADMIVQFRRHGLDEPRLAALTERGNGYRRGVPEMPSSYHRLFDGEQITVGDYQWRVIVGYGHAPEHASLYCEALGVLISGDMLLPRISTNISVYAATPNDDPLGWFLDSLRRINHLPEDTLVLPSHGKPFRGIRARVEQLIEHHRERCAALLNECGTARSAGELLGTLFPRELDTHQVMFAMGEAIAHLNHLEKQGALRKVEDDNASIRFIKTS